MARVAGRRSFRMPAGPAKRNRTAVTRVRAVAKPGGGWERVKQVPTLCPLLPRAAVAGTAVQLRVVAEEARELLLDRIFAARPQAPGERVVDRPPVARRPDVPVAARRPFDFTPLSRRHVRYKHREGQDGRILLATGDYVDGIEVFRGNQRVGGVYYMVRPANRTHEPSGLTLKQLARLMELGSARRKIPARPHWGPTTRDVLRRFDRHTDTVRAQVLRTSLRQIT